MRFAWLWSGLALVVVAIACGRIAFDPTTHADSSVAGDGSSHASDSGNFGDVSGDSASTRKACMTATDCSTIRCGCGLCDPAHGDCCMQATDCQTIRCGCNKCDPMYGECCTQATDCQSIRCGCGKCDPKPGDCCTNALDCASQQCVGGICM